MPISSTPEKNDLLTPEEEERKKIEAAAYEKKKAELHRGPCSSPRMHTCPCPEHCPLHGRCCDCILHHNSKNVRGRKDLGWTPACIRAAAGGIIGDLECFRKGYPVPHPNNLEHS